MTKLLHIVNRYTSRGGEDAAFDLIDAMLSQDETFSVERCIFESLDLLDIENTKSAAKLALSMWRNPSSLQRLRLIHHRFDAQAWVVHNVFPVGSAAIYEEALRCNVPVVQYLHNFRPFSVSGSLWLQGQINDSALRGNLLPELLHGKWQGSRLKNLWRTWITWRLQNSGWLGSVKRWIAISQFMKDRLVDAGMDPWRIDVLRHCWRLHHQTTAAPISKSESCPYFLFLGRLIEVKGIDILLQAWRLVFAELGNRSPELRIAGTGDMLSKIFKEQQKNPKIRYVGQVQSMAKQRLIANCRAMLAPSLWWEPLGLIAYEAFDSTKAVLAARSGGFTETVQHGVSGLLHEPGNAEELARHVIFLCEHSDRAYEMGVAGRSWLLEHTTPDQWKHDFRRIIESAVNGG